MKKTAYSRPWDLTTPDGSIQKILSRNNHTLVANVVIKDIDSGFVGFEIDRSLVEFNLKSTLAQLGIDAKLSQIELSQKHKVAQLHVEFIAIDPLGEKVLSKFQPGLFVGKLFALDDRRRVIHPQYLQRMFGRVDQNKEPILSFGSERDEKHLHFQKKENRTIANVPLLKGYWEYDPSIEGLIPTIIESLKYDIYKTRELLSLHQVHKPTKKKGLLLVRTLPLYVRTVFARVVSEELPKGLQHTSANILQPDTHGSGEIYELYGNTDVSITSIPIEFYTLEPFREYVFFDDRDQLKECLEKPAHVFKAFQTAPKGRAATFIVKSRELLKLREKDWILQEGGPTGRLPEPPLSPKDCRTIKNFVTSQATYPILQAMHQDKITSQGIILSRYFPSHILKPLLLGESILQKLKRIYFEYPSQRYGEYFSGADRSVLHDLSQASVQVIWADPKTNKLLEFVPKSGSDTGLFVPLDRVDDFKSSTMFGVYGSTLISGEYALELKKLFSDLVLLKEQITHPLFNKKTPLALLTGGGPGAMEISNKIASELDILSCGHVVNFESSEFENNLVEQAQNPYIEAKMTFRLDKLIYRQADFNLDFPIFLKGGIGTNFEQALEELRCKVGIKPLSPILLFGPNEYWKEKITSRYVCDMKTKTIVGAEWVSNTFFSVETAQDALNIYRRFFEGTLPIGPKHPPFPLGFVPG